MKKLAFPFLLLLLCPLWKTPAQQSSGLKVSVQGEELIQSGHPLTNESIVGLVNIGFSDDTIVSMIAHEPGNYFLAAADVIALRQAGVSEKVIRAMLRKSASGQAPTAALAAGTIHVRPYPVQGKNPPATSDSEIDNARIVQMTKLGLGDDIIIARIKTGSCKFALSDTDLAELKKVQVSDKVVAAMLEASVLARPRVTIDGNPAELHTIGQEKVGGRLGHDVSLHIKSVKDKAYLQGQHASLFAKSSPEIQIELPPNNTIDDYILVRMDGKGDGRELEVASGGGAVGHKTGIRSDRIEKMSYEPIGGRLYKVSVEKPLKKGEYILYIVGSADFEKGIFGRGYDFSVE